jgi:c-di-GMP-binding flagellar brake protein YcgR
LSDENKAMDGDTHSAAFEDIDLRPGAALQMQQEGVSGREQFTVRYVGAIPGVSFLATVPRRDGTPIWLPQGSQVTFRVLASVHAYAFTTAVLRARSRPAPYAHFAIPERVRYREVRRHPRVEVRLSAEITRADGTRSMAILRDISLRGATLEMAGMLAATGDTIRVDLPLILPELARKLEVDAVVRNCSDFEGSVEQGRFHYGIEFVEMSEEHSMLLHYFIDHLIAEMHARC